MIIPNIWENKKCSKPPTRHGHSSIYHSIIVFHQWTFSASYMSDHFFQFNPPSHWNLQLFQTCRWYPTLLRSIPHIHSKTIDTADMSSICLLVKSKFSTCSHFHRCFSTHPHVFLWWSPIFSDIFLHIFFHQFRSHGAPHWGFLLLGSSRPGSVRLTACLFILQLHLLPTEPSNNVDNMVK